jgi:LysM repeat protein
MSKKLLAVLIFITPFLFVAYASSAQAGGDYIVHTIKHGEVPSVLAKKYNVSLADLESLNNWGPKVILHVGDKVKLPVGAHLSTAADSVKPATPPVAITPAQEPQSKVVSATVTPVQQVEADTSHYVIHVIQKGEIPSVLARKYKVNVDELKDLNNWTPKTIWHVGDKVKLPRTPQTTTDEPAKTVAPPVAKVAAPVVDTTAKATPAAPQGSETTHVVLKKETLYSIGKKYKVTTQQIKDWNHLTDNNISEGQTLVLYTSTPVAQPATGANTPPAAPVVNETPAPAQPKQVVASKPVTPAPASVPPATQKPVVDTASANVSPEGYFASSFGKDIAGKNLQVANGVAMTFKTASGWTDKKYYVLMNDVAPGSIVKITTADGKSVYAKILWNMGDAQDSEGLNFRISDAAASVLGIKDLKFQLTVTYYR